MATATMEISEARKALNTIDERLKGDRVVVITRHNRGVFALIDLDTLSSVLKKADTLGNPEAMRMLRDTLAVLPAPL